MVAIPMPSSDPTLDELREVCKTMGKQEPRRKYLGASLIGNECARQIWYEYNGYEREPFEAKTLWAFESGHRDEDIITARLRLLPGIEVYTVQENGEQYGFSDFEGKFSGHLDGVILGLRQAPKTPHILEVKSCGQKKFDEFQKLKLKHGEKETLKNWNMNYYVQSQLYMHYFKLDRHYLVCALSGCRDMDSCRTEYDRDIAIHYKERAKMIIDAKEPPAKINERPEFFQCKWCNFKKVCHGANA